VEGAQLRLPLHPLQPIEVERKGLVLKDAIEDVLRALLQAGGRKRNVPGDLIPWVAGDDRADGPEPDRGPRLQKHCLEVAFRALLPGELQVALGFAVQVAFQHVAGDFRGHDPASGGDWGRP
jgi:hypothetical protein